MNVSSFLRCLHFLFLKVVIIWLETEHMEVLIINPYDLIHEAVLLRTLSEREMDLFETRFSASC